MRISINAPSYKRPNKVDTLKYLPSCKVWVSESEYPEYKKNYPDANLMMVPDSVQGNLCRVRNYILDQEQKDNDAVCIIDDDMSCIGYFEKKVRKKLKTEYEVYRFITKHSILAEELGVKLWGININQDKQCYREYTPFSLLSYIGGPFAVHLKTDLRYDERLPLKEDYDFTLQNLNKYRKVLRVNRYFYVVKQAEQAGGCATYRSIQREKEQLLMLQKKWGSDIVKFDLNDRSHKTTKKASYDINPIIKVPTKGV